MALPKYRSKNETKSSQVIELQLEAFEYLDPEALLKVRKGYTCF